ncbi:hypothetical protein U9M48_002120, partial [Paspalum notatum var. saurae]
KPFSPLCNLHTPSAFALASAIRNRCHGTPPVIIIQPDGYTGDFGWYASRKDVRDAQRKQPGCAADAI